MMIYGGTLLRQAPLLVCSAWGRDWWSVGEDVFAMRHNDAEDNRSGAGMRFEGNNGDESAPASDSDDREATGKNIGTEEELQINKKRSSGMSLL